jgi:tryptophanyl-tRNA synthetase
MFTDPNHLKISDPGKVEGNVVFEYLDAFHLDSQEVSDLKAHYRKGGLGDSTIKNILNTTLQTMLEPIREKRNSFKHGEVMDIIISGTAGAKKVTEKTLEEVRSAIGLRYFD